MNDDNSLMKKVLARKKMDGLDLTITINPSQMGAGQMQDAESQEMPEDKNSELAPEVEDADHEDAELQGLLGENSPLHSNALRKKVLAKKK